MHERSRCIGALTVSSGAACGKNLKHKNLHLCMPHHCASGSGACSCERHRYVIWTTDATSVTSGSSFDPELAAVADMLAAKSSHGSWLQLESLEGGTLPAQCKATCLDRLIRCRLSTLRHNNPQQPQNTRKAPACGSGVDACAASSVLAPGSCGGPAAGMYCIALASAGLRLRHSWALSMSQLAANPHGQPSHII